MARRQPIEIAKTLKHLLPKRRITTLAKEVGATQRERKVGSAAFVLSLILGFGVGNLRTLAILVRPPRDADVLERYLVPFLVAEAVDPNVARYRLLGRVEAGHAD